MAIAYPPIFINDYLAEKVQESFNFSMPFFPTSPSTIEQISQTLITTGGNDAGIFSVYDRMFRMRRKTFPHIKDEQLLYYFYATATDAIPTLIETTQVVQDLLDRGDESGQEVNSWIQSRLTSRDDGTKVYIKGDREFLPVFFHEFTIYQLEEARDIIDFGTARTYAGNKLIISYCYHSVGEKVSGSQKTYNNTII